MYSELSEAARQKEGACGRENPDVTRPNLAPSAEGPREGINAVLGCTEPLGYVPVFPRLVDCLRDHLDALAMRRTDVKRDMSSPLRDRTIMQSMSHFAKTLFEL